jgi:hypothetical protein
MIADVELLYRQHLSDADRRLLADVTGPDTDLMSALAHPAVEATVLGGAAVGEGGLVATTPFLTFAAAVHCTAARLERASYVQERWSGRQRLPVFDVAPLRAVVGRPDQRLFLIELLASYTHVASGVRWERTARGWRRHRFSELDPVRLAALLDLTEPAQHPGVYRRLGDLALFLTGVFPDHPSVFSFGSAATGGLLRASGMPPSPWSDLAGRELLERLGARWYRLAVSSARAAGAPMTSDLAAADGVSRSFSDVRRVLNVVADRYLFPLRDRWFGRPPGG